MICTYFQGLNPTLGKSLFFRDTRNHPEHDAKNRLSLPSPSPEKPLAEIDQLKKPTLVKVKGPSSGRSVEERAVLIDTEWSYVLLLENRKNAVSSLKMNFNYMNVWKNCYQNSSARNIPHFLRFMAKNDVKFLNQSKRLKSFSSIECIVYTEIS